MIELIHNDNVIDNQFSSRSINESTFKKKTYFYNSISFADENDNLEFSHSADEGKYLGIIMYINVEGKNNIIVTLDEIITHKGEIVQEYIDNDEDGHSFHAYNFTTTLGELKSMNSKEMLDIMRLGVSSEDKNEPIILQLIEMYNEGENIPYRVLLLVCNNKTYQPVQTIIYDGIVDSEGTIHNFV